MQICNYGDAKQQSSTLRAFRAMAHRSSESGTGMPALSIWLVKSFTSCSGTSTCTFQQSFQPTLLAQNPNITASTAFVGELHASMA